MPPEPWSADDSNHPNRRCFLRTSLAGGALAAFSTQAVAEVPPFDLDEYTISDLQEGMKSGKFTARSLAEKYLARIEAIDRQGPTLRAVIETNPDALALADALDKERKDKGPRTPLHGIPVLIKDNIDTSDRMATTAGSLALVGAKPAQDAFLVKQLRRAGAILLGKTNLSEWANIRSSHSTSGWSARGGLTKNPYALDRNPSGSSSGSAVAVAASLCAVAVGTETDGSIVSPASVNGVVGLKPTVGLISRTGIIPISHTQDTAGPMARTVRDAAFMLGILAAVDPDDQATAASKGKALADYTTVLDPKGLQGARIGVVRGYFGFHDEVDDLLADALAVLKKQGATLVDPADIETKESFEEAELTVLLYELKTDLKAYLKRLGGKAPLRSLKEIIDFNERNKKEEMRYFGQDLFLKAEAKGPLTDKEYRESLEKCRRLARTEGIDAMMDKHKLDALVGPTDAPGWLTDLLDGDHSLSHTPTAAAVAGYPHITVPAGFVCGMPVGISFIGRAWSEPTLLKLAYAFEQATKVRKPPRFRATADVR